MITRPNWSMWLADTAIMIDQRGKMSARRILATVATLTAAALVLVGCVTSGTVTGMHYDDPYTSCVGNRCTNYDECYLLELSNDQENGNVCVSQEAWENTEIGEFYDGPTMQRGYSVPIR